ncbi:hypothetical protein GQ457_17G007100 [Hibiscus cannabinus]
MEATKSSSSSSSSSITSEIFPSKVPPSSSSKILDSVFPPQSEVPEGQSLVSKMQDSSNEPLKAKPANSGHEGKSQSAANKEEIHPSSMEPKTFSLSPSLRKTLFTMMMMNRVMQRGETGGKDLSITKCFHADHHTSQGT